MTTSRVAVLSAVVLVAVAGVLIAGPLNPPAGPVTGTYKTLTDVEPRIAINATNTPGDADATPSTFKITQSGSYYLTGNVTLSGGRSAIEVTASGVTIDLNGFQIFSFGGAEGVVVTNASAERITIRDGVMIGVTTGVSCASTFSVTVQDLVIETALSGGIRIGDNGSVSGCKVVGSASGVSTGVGSEVLRTIVTNCESGIACSDGSRVSDCTVRESGTGTGSIAFNGSSGCIYERCVATNNTGTGFLVNTGSTVRHCSATFNGATGFAAVEASAGLAGCVFDSCAAAYNDNDGFNCDGSTLTNCNARANGDDGFDLIGCTLVDSMTSDNSSDGIVASADCVVRGCQSRSDSGSGISMTGSGNRIERNFVTFCGTGISAATTRNFIAGNTCKSNATNWNIVAGNQCLVVLGVDAGAIVGDAGGTSPGSTNPLANFTH